MTDTLVVSGRIDENLYQALDDSATVLPKGARAELAWTLADIFEYRVDMSRELQPGDQFRVLFERQVGSSGQTRIGRVLAARMVLSGATTETVRFDEGDGRIGVLRRDRPLDASGVPARAAGVSPNLERVRVAEASDPWHLAAAPGHRLRRRMPERPCARSATVWSPLRAAAADTAI